MRTQEPTSECLPAKASAEVPYLLFSSADQVFALQYREVVQVIEVPSCAKLPQLPNFVRGAIDFRGEPILLFDLRRLLRLSSLSEEVDELAKNLGARRQDHLNWIQKLKDRVFHGKEVALETDPRKCAFGRWYAAYETKSVVLAEYLRRFDAPHRAIHGLAVQAQQLIEADRKDAAKELIGAAERRELTRLLALFDGFEAVLRKHTHEYAVVIDLGERRFSLAVDAIRGFDRFDDPVKPLPYSAGDQLDDVVSGVGRKVLDGAALDFLVLDSRKLGEASSGGAIAGPARLT